MNKIISILFALFISMQAMSQITVHGNVKDNTGEPIIGATVRVVGTQTATVTDLDGNFTLKAKKGARITVSYVGFTDQTATVPVVGEPVESTPEGKPLSIIMKEDAQLLDNVVVIGYGTAKKNDLTGSVTSFKPDDKNHGIQTTAQDMIQGKIAGVNVSSSSGEPGGSAEIRIRGGASLNANNSPLIVIDGMPMDNTTPGASNPLALVNPNDIATFSVLKDASATAIYGSRGSNGVIIITTKKGHRNQAPKVSFNGSVSFSSISRKLDVMNASQYREFIKTTYGEDSKAYKSLGDADTDWQDEIYRTGINHDYNISVTGGVGNNKWAMPYRVSLGYTGQEGIVKNTAYQRCTTGLSLSPSLLNDHLTLNINGKYAYSCTTPGDDSANNSIIYAASAMDPTRPVKSSDEKYQNWGGYFEFVQPSDNYDPSFPYEQPSGVVSNPVELIDHNPYGKSSHALIGNIEIDYKIHHLEDLHLHANLAGEYATGTKTTNMSPYSTYGYYYGGNGETIDRRYNLLATAYAQYSHDFKETHSATVPDVSPSGIRHHLATVPDVSPSGIRHHLATVPDVSPSGIRHHLDIMAGYEYSRNKYYGKSWWQDYYPMTNEETYADGRPRAGTINDTNHDRWKGQTILVSWYGRANYTYKDRYLLTATARYDGSSRFADGHRWGFFPSAAFAWKVNEEPFLRHLSKVISDLKLRLGWGQTGQQDTGMEYYTPVYKKSANSNYLYPIGAENTGALYKPQVYNEDLTWETTTTYNLGIDYGMFKQRLTFNFDIYKRITTDLLCSPTIPAGMNYDVTMMVNGGKLNNTGVEFAIVGRPVQTKNWFLEVGINAAYNDNEVKELYGGRDMLETGTKAGNQYLTYHKVGEPANSFWVYQQVYDTDGRPIQGLYVDRNGDGTIDDNDRYFCHSVQAPWTGGAYFKLTYKKWDLGMNLRGSFGGYIYNDITQGRMNSSVSYDAGNKAYTNTIQSIADLKWTSWNYPLSDYFIQNASYIKCDNITLGYSFENLFKSAQYHGLEGRIYASCSNVFTITKYDGLDPEQTSGKESSIYPRSRTFLIGLNLNF